MGLSPNYSDAIRKIHQSNSTPFKKVNQSNFAIHFAKWEQHEMEHGSGKNKTFPVKITFLNCPITSIFFLPFLLSLMTLLIFVFYSVVAMLHVCGLLKLFRFDHM